MGISIGGKTDVGKKRENNQDFFLISKLSDKLMLLTVCDGMGGANGGSEASRLCAETFVECVRESIFDKSCKEYLSVLDSSIGKANDAVCSKAASDKEFEGMGTTIVTALYDGEKYYLAWVGDSRIYAITKQGIKQISHDHSFVQNLVDSGNITPDEAKNHPNRNIITKAVGIEKHIEADVCEMEKNNIEGILLCSDGLCGYVEESDISACILAEKDAEICCEKLVDLANENGGTDNITAVIHRTL